MPSIRTLGYIFVALCAIVILASFQTNVVIKKQLELVEKEFSDQTIKKAYKGKRKKTTSVEKQASLESRIRPEDPAKYGMVVTPARNTPKTMEQWEIKLALEFDKNGVFTQPAADEMLEKVHTERAKHAQEMLKLEKKITELEQQIESAPLNTALEEKLQELYKLRAAGKILERKAQERFSQPRAPGSLQ